MLCIFQWSIVFWLQVSLHLNENEIPRDRFPFHFFETLILHNFRTLKVLNYLNFSRLPVRVKVNGQLFIHLHIRPICIDKMRTNSSAMWVKGAMFMKSNNDDESMSTDHPNRPLMTHTLHPIRVNYLLFIRPSALPSDVGPWTLHGVCFTSDEWIYWTDNHLCLWAEFNCNYSRICPEMSTKSCQSVNIFARSFSNKWTSF